MASPGYTDPRSMEGRWLSSLVDTLEEEIRGGGGRRWEEVGRGRRWEGEGEEVGGGGEGGGGRRWGGGVINGMDA